MKFYLIRHGETDWNRLKKIQGQADNPLNENGRAEAKATAAAIGDLSFDYAYCSPLGRAGETAKIILKGRNLSAVVDDRLKEISYGNREGQSLYLIHLLPMLRLHKLFHDPEHYVPPNGGETFENLRKRCVSFLQEMAQKLPEEAQVVVSAHGCVIMEMLAWVGKRERKDFWKGIPQQNCAISCIEYQNGMFKILFEGKTYTG